jgi:endoglucanase
MSGNHQFLSGRKNVRRPSEAGALAVREINGQMTLTDSSGQPVQLRGMSTHGLQWYGEIVNENAFARVGARLGEHVIRLAMYIGEEGYATDPAVKDLVYSGIELAFANDMYVIVDWHVLTPVIRIRMSMGARLSFSMTCLLIMLIILNIIRSSGSSVMNLIRMRLA